MGRVVVFARAPITQGQFCLCFGYLLFVSLRLEYGEAFTDQIPGCLLRVFDLITTPDYARQRSHPQEDFRSGASVQAFEVRALAKARPQTTKQFLRFLIFPSVLEVFGDRSTTSPDAPH